MKILTSFILVFFLALLDFKIAEHHHEDYQNHDDCEFCIVQHQKQQTAKVEFKLNLELPTIPVDRRKEKQTLGLSLYKANIHIRAPPEI